MDHLENRTLLTIITEAAVEHALLKDLEKLGIKGYTVSDVRGRGVVVSVMPRGARQRIFVLK